VYVVQSAGTPFFSMNLLPFTEDPKTGMGGFRTLRGYSQDRFVGPVMAFGNVEARWTFATFDAVGQHFAMMLAPFVDFGRVFDRVSRTSLNGWAQSQGAGLRVAWNQATIVMFDYGVSQEGSALYVNFGHIF
jgi:hemolysin activation/secretion protein